MPPSSAAASTAASGARATEARTTMDALAGSPDVFETFFESAQIGLALADLSGRYVRVNDTYAALLGTAPEDLVGVALEDVLRESSADGPALDLLRAGGSTTVQAEASHRHADGRTTWLLHGVSTVSGSDGGPRWFAVSAQDITERRRAEVELRALTDVLAEQAVRDPLTGLANRALLEERLRAALSRDGRTGSSTTVLFLDLDGFKDVNDQHGHAVGDEVLRSIAERLTAVVRPADTVARLGGDEFVVLVEAATPETVDALLPRISEAVGRPSEFLGRPVTVGVSVGVATSTAGESDPAGLLACADARMYDAKRRR